MSTQSTVRVTLLLVGALACGWAARDARAQAGTTGRRPAGASGAAEAKVLKIRRLEGLGKDCRIRTPEYDTNVPRDGRVPSEWHQILVQFDTAKEWIDELTFQYVVMTQGLDEETRKPVYTLFRTTVRYTDVPRGDRHQSAAYLLPVAVKRFGEPVAVAVDILADGKAADSASAADGKLGKMLPENWWTSPAVVDNKEIRKRDGHFVERSKSPFALANIDSYIMASP